MENHKVEFYQIIIKLIKFSQLKFKMEKKVKIFDVLGIIDILKNYNNKVELFYIKQTFFLNILTNFFKIKKIEKLEWNFTNLI